MQLDQHSGCIHTYICIFAAYHNHKLLCKITNIVSLNQTRFFFYTRRASRPGIAWSQILIRWRWWSTVTSGRRLQRTPTSNASAAWLTSQTFEICLAVFGGAFAQRHNKKEGKQQTQLGFVKCGITMIVSNVRTRTLQQRRIANFNASEWTLRNNLHHALPWPSV